MDEPVKVRKALRLLYDKQQLLKIGVTEQVLPRVFIGNEELAEELLDVEQEDVTTSYAWSSYILRR